MRKKKAASRPSQRVLSSKRRGPQRTHSSQPPQAPSTPQPSAQQVPDEWDDTHWIAQWRTEPEIDAQRQKELAKCRARPAEREKEVYPFSGIHLNRADVEWLLATYDYNNWLPSPEASPRVMLSGADLRGTRLTGIDLRSAHLERANLSRTLLERDDLAGARLEGADLQKQIERLQGLMQDAQTIETTLRSTEEMLTKLRQCLEEPPTWELKRQLLEALIERILVNTVENEKGRKEARITVIYRFGASLQV